MTEQAQNHLTHPVEDWGGLPTRDTIIAHLSHHPEHAWRYPAGFDFGPPVADGTTGLDWAARHRKHHLATPQAAKPPGRAESPRCATCGRAAHWPGSPGPHGHPYLAPDA